MAISRTPPAPPRPALAADARVVEHGEAPAPARAAAPTRQASAARRRARAMRVKAHSASISVHALMAPGRRASGPPRCGDKRINPAGLPSQGSGARPGPRPPPRRPPARWSSICGDGPRQHAPRAAAALESAPGPRRRRPAARLPERFVAWTAGSSPTSTATRSGARRCDPRAPGPLRARGVGRPADPRLGRGLDGPRAGRRRPPRPRRPRRRPGTGRRRDSTTVMLYKLARARSPLGPAGRDRPRHRQLPDRPLVLEGIAAERGLDLRGSRPTRARASRPGRSRRARPGHRARRPQPRRLPLGAIADAAASPASSTTRRAHALGPEPLGRVGRDRARRLGADLAVGLHLQVPQRGSRLARVRLRARRRTRTSCSSRSGAGSGAANVRDGPGLRARRRPESVVSGTPPVLGMLPLDDEPRPHRGGGDRRDPREVGAR